MLDVAWYVKVDRTIDFILRFLTSRFHLVMLIWANSVFRKCAAFRAQYPRKSGDIRAKLKKFSEVELTGEEMVLFYKII